MAKSKVVVKRKSQAAVSRKRSPSKTVKITKVAKKKNVKKLLKNVNKKLLQNVSKKKTLKETSKPKKKTLMDRIKDLGTSRRLITDTVKTIENVQLKGGTDEMKSLSKRIRKAFLSKSDRAAKKEARGKRAMSGYMFFSQEQRQIIRKEKPELSMTAISVLLGNMWGLLSDQEKEAYKTKALTWSLLSDTEKELYKKNAKDADMANEPTVGETTNMTEEVLQPDVPEVQPDVAMTQ